MQHRKILSVILAISMLLGTFYLNPQSKVIANSTSPRFKDTKTTDWYYKDMEILVDRGLIAGYTDGTYKPSNKIRVDEFVKILVSALDPLVKPGKGYWAQTFINRAEELYLIEDGEFTDYSRTISRGEIARMLTRVSKTATCPNLNLQLPENGDAYKVLINDISTYKGDWQNIALQVFTHGIISGFPDGTIGLDKPTTRAEATSMMVRFLDKSRRNIPTLPEPKETVNFDDTMSVKDFTLNLLSSVGQTQTMEYALNKGYIRHEADYPSYDKPILRREAAMTMARVLEGITGIDYLLSSGKMEKFTKGELFTATLSPIEIEQFSDYFPKLAPVLNWKVYRGHIQDIYKITEEYQQEMVTLYLAGLIDTNDKGELKPYDFLTIQEGEEWIEKAERFKGKGVAEARKLLGSTTRQLTPKALPSVPQPSNASHWKEIYPYVDKSLYEWKYLYRLDEEDYGRNLCTVDNNFCPKFSQVFKNFYNTRYTVDYRSLDKTAPYYSIYNNKGGLGDYLKRTLFYYDSGFVTNRTVNNKTTPREDWIMSDDMMKTEVDNIKKYKVVSQAELVTHPSLIYNVGSFQPMRGTLRVIYYPPTDEAYLEKMGLEVGKWYEQDVEVWMAIAVGSYKGFRWETSGLASPVVSQTKPFRIME